MVQLISWSGKNSVRAALGLALLCACGNAADTEGNPIGGGSQAPKPVTDGNPSGGGFQAPELVTEGNPSGGGFQAPKPVTEENPSCVGAEAPEPVTVEATVSIIATGQDRIDAIIDTELSPAFIADGSGIYWHDTRGSVYAQRRGEAGVVQLLQGAERVEGAARASYILGMAASADQLYVTDGHLPTNAIDYYGIQEIEPPSRLLAVPKQGGPAIVLIESEDSTLWPIAALGDRLIVVGLGGNDSEDGVSLYQVDLREPRLEPLPPRPQFSVLRSAGDAMYWLDHRSSLMRSGFDDAQPREITGMTNLNFSVGPGYVMTRDWPPSTTGPIVINTVDVQDGSSSCIQLPSSAPMNSGTVALEPLHIHYVTLHNRRPDTNIGADGELVQLALDTGALTRMSMPGIALQYDVAIVGQDAENLYVQNGDTLLAVQKP
jgi:hypothetical protein